MTLTMEFVSKTQHYLKVKKPILERQRRARINKYLDALKVLLAEFKGDNNILRLDKAEMLESALVFLKNDPGRMPVLKGMPTATPLTHMDGFRNGYMNAVNEVSRVMASTPGMSVDIGKAVMVHLGREFNRILNYQLSANKLHAVTRQRSISPASSGYHSDTESSLDSASLWRPW